MGSNNPLPRTVSIHINFLTQLQCIVCLFFLVLQANNQTFPGKIKMVCYICSPGGPRISLLSVTQVEQRVNMSFISFLFCFQSAALSADFLQILLQFHPSRMEYQIKVGLTSIHIPKATTLYQHQFMTYFPKI